jgi:DNA adenine methylase
MKIAKDAPKRPALRYYGGGWLRSEWTISHFPAHDIYVEPCFGAGSILLRKPISILESVGDLDDRVVNFFLVLRARRDELLEQINLTPWAESELHACMEVSDDPLEDARRFFFACWMSIHGGPTAAHGSFRFQKSVEGRYASPPLDAINRDDLIVTAERLRNVQIFKRDAIDMIKKWLGTGALIYFDPPYLERTRARRIGYNHEVTPAWHRYAALLLRQHEGPVVVSGYYSDLYERIYENYGWKRVEREYNTNGKSKATECLWLNPICQDQLAAEQHHILKHDMQFDLFTKGA